MKKKWYETWFDSKYYHMLYKHRDEREAEAFIKRLVNVLHLKKDARLLDLGCGKGRHAITLNKLGYDVTGIDLSEQSISHAKQFENNTLSFYVHDMRTPLRTNYFDAVFNLFTSFGYFENEKDNSNVVRSAAIQLKENGLLVIDFFNANKVHGCREEKQIDGVCFKIHKHIENKHVIKDIQFTDKGQTYDYTERVQLLGINDFKKYLEQHHFKTVHLFGNYLLDPFDAQTSDRLIVVAQKNK